MGLMDAFNAEDRTEVKVTTLYQMLKQGAKFEIVMNGINCDVPHKYLREMMSGKKEEVPVLPEKVEVPALPEKTEQKGEKPNYGRNENRKK